MRIILTHIIILWIWTTTSLAQIQTIGSKDYGLAASSVMWLPRSGALFLNPSELGRVHQNEFLFSTSRFRQMVSMSGTCAIPFVGTCAAGVGNQDSLTQYTLGLGRLISNYHTIGGAISILAPIKDGFRFSLGGALHVPYSSQNSGIHAGLSFENLPKAAIINGGMAYWALPNTIRVQLAVRSRVQRAMGIGAEILASDDFSLIIGSRGFSVLSGGFSYRTSTFTTDLVAGTAGISFSLNILIGESAEDHRSIAYEEGYNLFSEKRFHESRQKFLTALEYDEYDDDSRSMAREAKYYMDSVETTNLQLAKIFEEKQDYPAAITSYSNILRANPSNRSAENRLTEIHEKFGLYVAQLITIGDSLRERNEITRARKNYELALKYDPENDDASSRIDELDSLSKENVRAILSRAQSFLKNNQLDNAQKEYERGTEYRTEEFTSPCRIKCYRSKAEG